MPTFTTTLVSAGGNNVGIVLADDQLADLGRGKRAPVTVTLNGYTYRSTPGVMGGRNLVGVNAAHRKASGVAAGDTLEVTIEVDDAPRVVEVPEVLATALAADEAASTRWDAWAPSARKEHARSIGDAKTGDTRDRRLAKTMAALRGES